MKPIRSKFTCLPLGAITARGWLRRQLEVGRDGMGGHFDELEPDQVAKPFVTRDYDPSKGGGAGLVGWCAEISSEYWLGLQELAWTLGDDSLKAKFDTWMRAFLALREDDGYLGSYRPGDNRHDDFCTWGVRLAYRALLQRHAQTGDKSLLDAVHEGLLWFVRNWDGDNKTDYVGSTIIEQMVQVHLLTGDRRLLDWCEDYASWLDRHGGKNTFLKQTLEIGANHVGALATRVVLPAILSLANGRADYLRASEDAIAEFGREVGWQAHYGPGSDREHVSNPGCISESEYCDFVYFQETLLWLSAITGRTSYADHVERIVFNAAQGARRKDDRAIAYQTSANQFLATMTSSRWGWHDYYEVYAPNVCAACCPANSVRVYPEYLRQAVLRDDSDGLYVQLYGPYHVEAATSSGAKVLLESETEYPFGDAVTLRVSASDWRGKLMLRRPGWALDCRVVCSDFSHKVRKERDGMIVVSGPWKGQATVTVAFVREPVVRPLLDRDFGHERLRAIDYGPLVFVQPLKEKWTPTKQSENSWPTPPEWPWYDVTCAEQPPYYALTRDAAFGRAPIRVKTVAVGDDALPWVTNPLRLEVPMVRSSSLYPGGVARWSQNMLPLANPAQPDRGASTEIVELVPYGSTCLRVTCFPVAAELPPKPVIVPVPMVSKVTDGVLRLRARPCDCDDDCPRIPIGLGKIEGLIRSATTFTHDDAIEPEGYALTISPDGVSVRSSTDAGAFYALQSARQLAVREDWDSTEIVLPCMEIRDWPKFPWRGLHLDEARHFFGKKAVMKFLDLMAYHKLNVFHWHLTDDQGWRLELRRHPELVAFGAKRACSPLAQHPDKSDGLPYGPFFHTQEDIREILAYAATRHITVVPEIEMPGHVRALLAAHPEFSCVGEGLSPREPRAEWGIEDDVICAGNDAAIAFLEDVLDEVCELFPGKVIHIGGDECPKERWKACPKCQARIRELGLADEKALQGWLAGRISSFLASKGRRAIGWTEIADGGNLDPAAMVMDYFGPPRTDAIAAEGHDVVCCPGRSCYFDWPQFQPGRDSHAYFRWGDTASLERVYLYDPTDGVAPERHARILGAQGNNWSEYTTDLDSLLWKAYPRACALAEALWTYPCKSRNVEAFKCRLRVHRPRLLALGVNCAPV